MRKATFFMSAISCIASVATLGIVLVGAKKVHDEVEEIRTKTNEKLGQLKKALIDFQL